MNISVRSRPATRIGWSEKGSPLSRISGTASSSDMPGRTPQIALRTNCDECVVANSKRASCSTSLIARNPLAGSISSRLALRTSQPSRAHPIDDEGRRVDPVLGLVGFGRLEILPAGHANHLSRATKPGGRPAGWPAARWCLAAGRATRTSDTAPAPDRPARRPSRPAPRCRRTALASGPAHRISSASSKRGS